VEIGIAGWALNKEIRVAKTCTQLELPALAKRDYGVSAIEFVSTFFENQGAPYLNAVRKAAEAAGVTVRNIAVDGVKLGDPDPATSRTDLEAIKQWFHVAKAIGSAAIRVNTASLEPGDTGGLARIADGYAELAEHGASTGIKVLLENHGGASSDPAAIAYLLDCVPNPWFATCPDNGNFPGDTWEEGMRVMIPRAFSFHVKVFGYDPSGEQSSVGGDGTTRRSDLRRSLQMLKASGYSGPVCFEYNSAETDEREGIRKGIEYTRAMLAGL
jgi:sugar phosphate isomerase/epimerase